MIRKLLCFLKGHRLIWGSHDESSYCGRCYREKDDWPATVPNILNCIYCWLVDRKWEWFDNLDDWVYQRVDHGKIPSWWEY